jgi:quinol monooxygenase YgiN
MFVLSLRVRVPENKRDEILRSLRALVGPASAQAACVSCRVFQESDDPDSITFVQAWTSQQDLERHVRARQYRVLLAVADLSEGEPEIRIDGLSPQGSGLEVLESLLPQQPDPPARVETQRRD